VRDFKRILLCNETPMTTCTAEESKQNYKSAMGEPLGALFYSLWQEVAWVHLRWHEYVALYGDKPSRVALLNNSAPGFFRIVQDTLWEATLLHIARLTDAPCSAGKSNLTIQRLHDEVRVRDANVAQRVKTLSDKAKVATEFCRDWRNRRIAHSDLSLALDENPTPLEAADRDKVNTALSAIVDVLNAVSLHYMNSSSFFDIHGYPGDVMSLLCIIDDGLRVEAERRDRLKRREVGPDDYSNRNL
jgi:hypothetical protein